MAVAIGNSVRSAAYPAAVDSEVEGNSVDLAERAERAEVVLSCFTE